MKKILIICLIFAGCQKDRNLMEDVVNVGPSPINIHFENSIIQLKANSRINTEFKNVLSIQCLTQDCEYYYRAKRYNKTADF